jgi:hypothetical protein
MKMIDKRNVLCCGRMFTAHCLQILEEWRNPPPPVADRASRTFFPHGPKSLKTLLSLIGSSQPTVTSALTAPLVLYPGERFGTSRLASPDVERSLPGSSRPEGKSTLTFFSLFAARWNYSPDPELRSPGVPTSRPRFLATSRLCRWSS